ncbi:MAG: hypothetical protein GX491_10515 [Chloroflexi bacterium]|nr:hypothetical protein [Chloroflexota bacterium]
MSRAFDDDLFDDEFIPALALKNIPRKKKHSKPRRPLNVAQRQALESDVLEQEDTPFDITYKAARYEAQWLHESLSLYVEHKWFDDVLRMIKGGKEASVYLCKGNETTGLDFLAVKVYRPRMFRNLKNDWLYREGRADLDEQGNQITDKGKIYAMRKRTEFGRELLHISWLEHEYNTMRILHEAGADVPKPFASSSNAILMEYFGDKVVGAPTLNEVDLDTGEAKELYERVIHNIDIMLSKGRIHGDLSAYNILYWEGEIVLIDFPQAVSPTENRSAYRIFERDVTRVSEYFQRMGVRSNPRHLAAGLWQRYQQAFTPQIDPKMLSDEEGDRAIWESLKNA